MVKSRGQQIRFKIFGRPPLGHTIKKLNFTINFLNLWEHTLPELFV